MSVVRTKDAPTFAVEGFHIIGLTAPSRGASELCTWRLDIEPHAISEAHWLDHEEVFILLEGTLTVTVSGEDIELHAGDALSVPARSLLQPKNTSEQVAHAVVCLPVGTHATMTNGSEVGTPPWAQ